jgi:cation diffusion facilitator CzcD-associated flavoprotein CzcO
MFTLGFPFRPWASTRTIVDGASIRRYIEETAAEYGVDRRIRFGHRVVRAEWSEPEARWLVTAERTDGGGAVELSCGFLFSCTGYYRYEHGHEPDIPDRERFGGRIVHPQAWPEDLDVGGKQVVVIGSGSTAVTLVPALAETAGHVTMLQRSPTYIASVPSVSPIGRALRRIVPARQTGVALRWLNALLTQGFYQFCRRRPRLARRILERGVARQLPPGYDVAKHFSPRYEPWDERLCAVPDGDLFRCIR